MFGMKKKVDTDDEKIDALLTRGVENIFPNQQFLRAKLKKGEQVSLYLGIDPTGPTLHLGHVITIKKLAQFQKLGHKIILLIGDFTAMIGDPTDKAATRKKLSRQEVLDNCKNYRQQASKFLDFEGDNKAELKFNSTWLSKMSFEDVVELASHMTVQQMLERDMFHKRMEEGKPIHLHEFLYPLMQGYDSVAMDVDGEIGGNDQTFNMLAGRNLMQSLKNKEKFVLTTKLLVDPTGKKMGKSEGNMVALDQSPEDMFGKVMSWSDDMIIPGFEIATDMPIDEIENMKLEFSKGKSNPKEYKMTLAKEIVKMCYGKEDAEKACESFIKTFSDGGIPENIETIVAQSADLLGDVLVAHGVVESKTDFRRLVEAGAVTNLDTNTSVTDFKMLAQDGTYKIGKRRFVRINLN